MKVRVNAIYITDYETDSDFLCTPANKCPLCHTSFDGTVLSAYLLPEDEITGKPILNVLHFCHYCEQCFLSVYSPSSVKDDEIYKLIQSAPYKQQHEEFSRYIKNLSPRFIEIYNQAADAEKYGLNEICGMGYRKALEFLVKDYCIHTNPDETDNIKTNSLSQCINKYIKEKNPTIKTLVQKSAWLGNDQTHYVIKHTDRDINDLKHFIEATVYYISMEMTAEDASSIELVQTQN